MIEDRLLTSHTLQISVKFDFLLCIGGALTCLGVHLQTFPFKLRPQNFSPPLGVHVDPVQPPGYTYAKQRALRQLPLNSPTHWYGARPIKLNRLIVIYFFR